MSSEAAELDIDAILARVRAELPEAGRAAPASFSPSNPSPAVYVPLLEERASPKTEADAWTIENFEALDDFEFLHMAYRVILGRDIDPSGLEHYLSALREGRTTPLKILLALRFSPEGEAKGGHIPHLKKAHYLDRAGRIPVLGPLVQLLTSGRDLRRLQRRIAAADKRQRELVSATNVAFKTVRRHLAASLAEAGAARTAVEKLNHLQSEWTASRQSIVQETARLGRLINEATPLAPASPQQLDQTEDRILDPLYLAFENRFRGSTAEIRERQAHYLSMFQKLEPLAAGGTVLDIGCGRGEWLELLQEGNFPARGIDLSSAMLAQARQKGLDVVEGNALAYLQSQPENSIAAITGFHIVEHLPFKELVRLFDEAWRTLSPGGAILFETPNPENLVVGACTFNYDPTHNRPLPPDFLRFLAEARGYGEVRIIRTKEDCDLSRPESGFSPSEINDWFRQPPDYALFARKQVSPQKTLDQS